MRKHLPMVVLGCASLSLATSFLTPAPSRGGSSSNTTAHAQPRTSSPAQSTREVVQVPTAFPPILRTDDGAYLWRSASALLDGSGDVVPSAPSVLRGGSPDQAAGKACINQVILVDPWDESVDTSWPTSLSEFVKRATAVLVGTVVGVEGGILHDEQAGLMLELAITNVIKSSPAFGSDTVFVFYPAGDVRIGARVICRLSGQLPGSPRLGDSVLLGPRRAPISLDPVAISLLGTGVEILVHRDSNTFIPKGLKGVPDFAKEKDFDALVKRTMKLARSPIRRESGA